MPRNAGSEPRRKQLDPARTDCPSHGITLRRASVARHVDVMDGLPGRPGGDFQSRHVGHAVPGCGVHAMPRRRDTQRDTIIQVERLGSGFSFAAGFFVARFFRRPHGMLNWIKRIRRSPGVVMVHRLEVIVSRCWHRRLLGRSRGAGGLFFRIGPSVVRAAARTFTAVRIVIRNGIGVRSVVHVASAAAGPTTSAAGRTPAGTATAGRVPARRTTAGRAIIRLNSTSSGPARAARTAGRCITVVDGPVRGIAVPAEGPAGAGGTGHCDDGRDHEGRLQQGGCDTGSHGPTHTCKRESGRPSCACLGQSD